MTDWQLCFAFAIALHILALLRDARPGVTEPHWAKNWSNIVSIITTVSAMYLYGRGLVLWWLS